MADNNNGNWYADSGSQNEQQQYQDTQSTTPISPVNGGAGETTGETTPIPSVPTYPQSFQNDVHDDNANGFGNADAATPTPAAQSEPVAQSEQPTQPVQSTPVTQPDSSAQPEQSAPSAQPEQPTQPVQQPLYRPAPEYGAYGPTPTTGQYGQPSGQGQAQAPQYGQPATAAPAQGAQPEAGNSTPVNPAFANNPFMAGAQNVGNTPFGPQGPQNPQGPSIPGVPGVSGAAGNGNGKGGVARGVVTAVVAALVSAALCLGVGYVAITDGWVKVPTSSSLANIGNSNSSSSGSATAKSGEAPDWTSVASDVSASVVSIQTVLSNGTAKGSGAIVDTEGHIVTNNHVISGAQQIQVTLSNGQIYSAQVVGTDTTTDLAVIKLDNPPSDLKAVEFADSDKLAVGESVMAIGNPLGYDDTATTGIVSALNRPVTVTDDSGSDIVTNAVQIDAAINPGNSGGPTFNAAGQVIGINSSIASTATSSDSAGSIGIGFAIPSNLVKRVANEIIKDGSVKHVALGVTITTDTAEADGITRAGAKVTKSASGSGVVSGSPADKAGLKVGDVIVAYNGNAVSSTYSLLGFVRASALGDKATLTIVRDGKTMDVDVTLDQEESAVNGSSSSSNGNSNGNNQNQDGNGSNGYGNGNSDGNGSDGFSDPFGLW